MDRSTLDAQTIKRQPEVVRLCVCNYRFALIVFTIVSFTAYWSIPSPDWERLESLTGRSLSVPTRRSIELNLDGPKIELSIVLGRNLVIQYNSSEGVRHYYPFYAWQNVDGWEREKRNGLTDEQRQTALDWLDQLNSSIEKVKPRFEQFDRNKFILGKATHSSLPTIPSSVSCLSIYPNSSMMKHC